MFSLQHMHRQFTSRRFDQLLKSVIHNGMQLPSELQNHLLNHPVCSVALGLRRTMELSYGPPNSQTKQMIEFLLQAQEDNGSFGFAPLPTACALAALTKILKNAPQGSPLAQRPQALHQAQTHARTALDEMVHDQTTHGLPQTSLHDTPLLTESDAMDWAFILQLLSDDTTWEGHSAIEKLHHWFHANTNQLPTQILRLWHRTCWTPTHPRKLGDQNLQPRKFRYRNPHPREFRHRNLYIHSQWRGLLPETCSICYESFYCP